MLRLDGSLRAFGTPALGEIFKCEIARQSDQLPLQQGLCGSSSVADEPVTAVIFASAESETAVRIKAGIFYQGVIGGCSCADDPTLDNTNNEYCEMLFEIEKCSSVTTVSLVADQDNRM